jgi:hypothetical protein
MKFLPLCVKYGYIRETSVIADRIFVSGRLLEAMSANKVNPTATTFFDVRET